MSSNARTVGDIMSRQVISVGPRAGYRRLVQLLSRNAISGIPVVDGAGRPLGIVSEDDLLAKERAQAGLIGGAWDHPWQLTADRLRARALRAGELMTSPAVTVTADTPLALAAGRMHDEGIRRLVVVDTEGRLVGIVSRRDLLSVHLVSDEDVRLRVLEAIRPRAQWTDVSGLEVSVAGGVVRLAGELECRSDALAISAAARSVDGVVDVRGDLRWRVGDVSVGSHLDDVATAQTPTDPDTDSVSGLPAGPGSRTHRHHIKGNTP